MTIIFCIFLFPLNAVVIVVVAIEFENAVDIVSVTTSIPSKVAMCHFAGIRHCTCAN